MSNVNDIANKIEQDDAVLSGKTIGDTLAAYDDGVTQMAKAYAGHIETAVIGKLRADGYDAAADFMEGAVQDDDLFVQNCACTPDLDALIAQLFADED